MKAVRETLGAFDVRVWRAGPGAAAALPARLRAASGRAPFLSRLGERHAVRAPEHPGFGESTGFEHVDDIFDVTLHYRRLDRALGRRAGRRGGPLPGRHVRRRTRGARAAAGAPAGAGRSLRPVAGRRAHAGPVRDEPGRSGRAKWHDAGAGAGREPSAFEPAEGDTHRHVPRPKPRHGDANSCGRFRTAGLTRRLQYVTAPTLIVRGASDGLFPAPYLDAWTAAIAGARAVTLEAPAHLPMVEAEDAFIEAVESFLA